MSNSVLSLGLRGGLKVIILRGCSGGGDERGVADEGTLDGRDEGLLIAIDELYKDAEGLSGGERTGDKRKFRMGRGSAELGREGAYTSWSFSSSSSSSLVRFEVLVEARLSSFFSPVEAGGGGGGDNEREVSRSLTSALIL